MVRCGTRTEQIKYFRKDNGAEHTTEIQRTCWDIGPAPIFQGGTSDWLDDLIYNHCRTSDTPES